MEFVIPRPDQKYLFIDGEYFRRVVDRYRNDVWKRQDLPFDLSLIANAYERVFFYDCPAPRKKGESEEAFARRREEQKRFHNELSSLDKFHLVIGRTAGEGKRTRQKGIDVRIAVDMLMFVQRGCARRLTLLSGDADFEPLVEALVQLGVHVTVLADRKTASKHLFAAADTKQLIDPNMIRSWIHEDVMQTIPVCGVASGLPQMPVMLVRNGKSKNGRPVHEYRLHAKWMLRFGHPCHTTVGLESNSNAAWSNFEGEDRDLLLRLLHEYVGEIRWDVAAAT
jgi:uncharacterized LabA/DUF88 family protein